MTTKFEVFLFSPDGYFTAEEVKKLIENGFKWMGEKKGTYCRLSPIEVKEIEEEPMTKYYTMKECFDACENDDVPFIEGGFNSASLETKKELFDGNDISLYPTASLKQALSDKWQIKRAGPKVLSAREMRVKMGVIPEIFDGVKQIDDFGEAMDKNGQLREWLRPEQVELREAVKAYLKRCTNGVTPEFKQMKQALENLKQPV